MANIKISELNPLLTVEDADVLPIVDNAVTKKVTAAILRSYTQGNSVLLTGAQTVAGIKTFTSQLASSVATGTAPFSVASTTKVTNLNADLLDGLSSADFQATLSGTGIVKSTAGTISYLTDNTANWDTAYNDKINSAAVTGSGTNTLTLTQQDAGTITATWVNGTLIREVRNTTGATLTKGTIVYISGATGNKPTVTKAIASGDSTSAQTFGFIQSDLANNANGYVVIVGDLTGVDTSAFAEGDQLYLSSTVAGAFTSTKQYAPAHLVYVGIVTRSHPTLGQIEVNIQNGYELDELHNVSAQSPSNGDILQFVTSTGLWTKVAGTTTNISEGTNLYFTDARSRSAISLTTTGTSGASTYNSTTGVLNIPNYGTALANYLPLAGGTLTGTLNGTTSIMSGVGLNYGFQGLLSAGTGRWNLYMSGTAANHLQGDTLIGTTSNPSSRKLLVSGTFEATGNSLIGGTFAVSNRISAIGSTSDTWATDANEGLVMRGTASASSISTISTYLDNSSIRIGAGVTQKTGILINGQTSGAGSSVLVSTGGATRLTIASTGAATFSSSVTTGGQILVNTGTSNQNTTISGSKVGMSRTSDGAEVVYFSKNTDLGADGTANIQGYNGIQFRTQGAETVKLTLNEVGNLGLGITPSTATGFRYIQFGAGAALSTNNANNSNFYHNTTFNASGNPLYAVSSQQSSFYRQINGQHVWAYAAAGTAGNALTFTNNMVLDTAGSLQLLGGLALSGGTAPASGILFPATQVASANANNLDDYEEGTWTMGVSFGGGTTGITYSANTGSYTKIGRQVTVVGYLVMTNKGTSTGDAKITGLPFTTSSSLQQLSACSLSFQNITFLNQLHGSNDTNATTITLAETSTLGVATTITNADFANNSVIVVTLTYNV